MTNAVKTILVLAGIGIMGNVWWAFEGGFFRERLLHFLWKGSLADRDYSDGGADSNDNCLGAENAQAIKARLHRCG
jgi:hypothetical protein